MSEIDVLIVEDDPGYQDLYQHDMTGRLTFASATTRQAALEQVRMRRFNAAIIDLQLADDSQGGAAIVADIHARAEGTACVVVSGTSTVSLASEMALRYGVSTMEKLSGLPDLPTFLEDLAERGRRDREIPSTPRIQSVLRGELSGWDWEDRLIRQLPPGAGGIRAVNELLSVLVAPIWPLVSVLEGAATQTVSMGPSNRQVPRMRCWSRRLGENFDVYVGEADAVIAATQRAHSAGEARRGRLLGVLVPVPKADQPDLPEQA